MNEHMNVDLELLKEQKQTLVELLMGGATLTDAEVSALDGVVNLLDSIQDDLEGTSTHRHSS